MDSYAVICATGAVAPCGLGVVEGLLEKRHASRDLRFSIDLLVVQKRIFSLGTWFVHNSSDPRNNEQTNPDDDTL